MSVQHVFYLPELFCRSDFEFVDRSSESFEIIQLIADENFVKRIRAVAESGISHSVVVERNHIYSSAYRMVRYLSVAVRVVFNGVYVGRTVRKRSRSRDSSDFRAYRFGFDSAESVDGFGIFDFLTARLNFDGAAHLRIVGTTCYSAYGGFFVGDNFNVYYTERIVDFAADRYTRNAARVYNAARHVKRTDYNHVADDAAKQLTCDDAAVYGAGTGLRGDFHSGHNDVRNGAADRRKQP